MDPHREAQRGLAHPQLATAAFREGHKQSVVCTELHYENHRPPLTLFDLSNWFLLLEEQEPLVPFLWTTSKM
eukprot:3681292-Amphidinium_carterae.1